MSEPEIDNTIAYVKSLEVRAETAEAGLEKIVGIVAPLQEQMQDLTEKVNAVPRLVEEESRKAYGKGFRDGLVIGGGAVLLISIFI